MMYIACSFRYFVGKSESFFELHKFFRLCMKPEFLLMWLWASDSGMNVGKCGCAYYNVFSVGGE